MENEEFTKYIVELSLQNKDAKEESNNNQLKLEVIKYQNIEMDEKSLQIGVYEHYQNYPESRIVGIITDQQLAMYTQYQYDGFNHDTALPYLDKRIYPFKKYDGFYIESKDISVAGDSNVIYFSIPETISKEQLFFLSYTVDEIGRYNREFEDREKVEIVIFSHTECISSIDTNEIKKGLAKFPLRDKIMEKEEVLVGKTVNDLAPYLEIFQQENTTIDLLEFIEKVESHESL